MDWLLQHSYIRLFSPLQHVLFSSWSFSSVSHWFLVEMIQIGRRQKTDVGSISSFTAGPRTRCCSAVHFSSLLVQMLLNQHQPTAQGCWL